MWLLDSKTLELKLYYDNKIPPYAILSHAWGENEVSFQQLNGPRDQIQFHAGFIKIQKCCAQAAMDGFERVWIDTCCIDKTNSAELSEAINSMFSWYRNATECYIYLADVTDLKDLAASRWFTRGWTLQELIAPASAIFFNKDWIEVGTKSSLAQEISTITKIPIEVLLFQNGQKFSVAQVMSWAAKRQTTRMEDMGYCLLGIFGVNMPMIYGEGKKAFLRLQYEIIKASTDQSLFAWTTAHLTTYPRPLGYRGAFAWSPTAFFSCGSVVQTTDGRHSEFFLTNKGLRIEVMLAPPKPKENVWIAYLECGRLENSGCRLGILLRKLDNDRYIRMYPATTLTQTNAQSGSLRANRTTIYIAEYEASSLDISTWTDSFPRRRYFTFIIPKTAEGVRKHGFLESGHEHYPHQNPGLFDYLQNRPLQTTRDLYLSGIYSITHSLRGGSAFKFQHESNPSLQFIVLFGVTDNACIWSNIELASDSHKSLDAILRSYIEVDNEPSGSTSHALAEDNVRDRVRLPLENGSTVNLALKKMNISGSIQYMVNITII